MFGHNDELHWDMDFIRLVHDWEVDFKSSIFNALYSVRMGQGDDDKFCWICSERRYFEVKTFNTVHPNSDFSFHCKSI
jgi:hypothetical protein